MAPPMGDSKKWFLIFSKLWNLFKKPPILG